MINDNFCGNCLNTGSDHRGRACECGSRGFAPVRHYSTARRVPFGGKSANGTSFTHMDGPSLRPITWKGEGWKLGSIVSDLHLRGMRVMQDDPTVTAVTTLIWG